jgi:hypothetical protein
MKVSFGKYKKFIPDFFKFYDQWIILMWKLGLGKLFNYLPSIFGHMLVVGQPGHRVDGDSFIPMSYFSQREFIYCTPTLDRNPDWYLSMIANPQVEIWLPDGWYTGSAEIVENIEERAAMLRRVLASSGFSTALLLGVNLQTVDEDRFREITAGYHLLRINRQSPRTGADGPGSLAWIWPLVFLLLLLKGRRRK